MAQQTLLGGDGVTGESGATHNTKANANFTELYAATAAAQADADAAQSDLSTHISDPSGAHAGSAISFTPAGGLSSTDVQAAIVELAGAGGVGSATELAEGIIELATQGEVNTGTDAVRAVTPATLTGKVVGVQDLAVPAAAMWPRNTNGSTILQTEEMSTSILNLQFLEFDETTTQYAQFLVTPPRKYNNGTITARFKWKPKESGSGNVKWGIQLLSLRDDDALTTAFGTAVTVTDAFIVATDLHITSVTGAITAAGTVQDANWLAVQVYRDAADTTNDTLNVKARLLEVQLFFTTDAAIDA